MLCSKIDISTTGSSNAVTSEELAQLLAMISCSAEVRITFVTYLSSGICHFMYPFVLNDYFLYLFVKIDLWFILLELLLNQMKISKHFLPR